MTNRPFFLLMCAIAAGCVACSGSSPTAAPDAAAAQSCRASSECGDTNGCTTQAPLRPICAGTCEPASTVIGCQADSDCASAGPGSICGTLCACAGDGLIHPPHCIAGCRANGDCNPGEVCDATHHCKNAPCVQASDCPANLACRDLPSGTCAPKICQSDADCTGYCVNGFCSARVGVCRDAVGL